MFNIFIGLLILDVVRKGIILFIDVYLMIENLEKYIVLFVEYGVDMILIYVELMFYIYCVI